MKKLKQIFAAFLSILFAFSFGKVFADDSTTYTLTINGVPNGHIFNVSQIFAGDISADGTTLSNITWGKDVTPFTYKGTSDAAEIAEILAAEEDDSATLREFATTVSRKVGSGSTPSTTKVDDSVIISGLAPGYYLVRELEGSLGHQDASYTRFILKVVGDATAEFKSDKPSVEKKVKDVNDTTGEVTDWQDSADYDIGDSVPFKLTASLPSNIGDYENYYLEFRDSLSYGLTYNKDAKVYLVNGEDKTDVTSMFDISSLGTYYRINNLKSLRGVTASTKVVVEYTATLNQRAVIGSAGNPNRVKLYYSNNPNYTGAQPTYGNTGETPEDEVIVFTYQVIVNKVDQDHQPLEGAGFTLFKKDVDGNWNKVGDEITDVTTFEFKGLDDGDYKLSETTTPRGYNTVSDLQFRVWAKHSELSDAPTLDQLSWTSLGTLLPVEHTMNLARGSFTFDVINKKGSILPSTGGVGTTILYVIGAVLVLVSSALLITRKRMTVE